MNRVLLFGLLLLCSCAPSATESEEMRRLLINPVRLEIYLYESNSENECSKFLENPDLRSQNKPDLIRHSWADFESHGFASVRIDHLHSSQRVLIFVTAIDPSTNEILGFACAQNVEVEKGVLREVQLTLHSISSVEAKE